MKMILRITKWELQKMFYSPIAWVMLIAFAIMVGINITSSIEQIMQEIQMGFLMHGITNLIYTNSFSGLFVSIQQNMFWFIPLITMGLLSKEFSSGTIKLLYSSPITNTQIILGKFLSAVIFSFCMILILFSAAVVGMVYIDNVDLGHLLTATLGLFLVLITLSSIGLFMSSLTSYQIVAGIATFAALFTLYEIGSLWQDIEMVRNITYWLSIGGRSKTFISGMISSKDLLYFVLVTILFLVFAILKLKGQREKNKAHVSVLQYVGAFLTIAALGYLTTLPKARIYYDATTTKTNTLTEKSQEVVKKLDGKLTIDTYVNIFDNNYSLGSPERQLEDMKRYENYERFHNNFDFNYHYYYGIPSEKQALRSFKNRNEGLSLKEALNKTASLYNVNADLFKPASAYAEDINLESELNRYVAKLSSDNGKAVNLRLFDDNNVIPLESQITAAIKRLTNDIQLVGFVTGHMERDVNDSGPRGFQQVAQEKNFRWSLLNNGLDIITCNLSSPVDASIKMLVIAESKFKFSDKELKNLNDYIDKGGNLVIAADKGRQEAMNPLVSRFGIQFMSGQLVEFNEGYTMDLVTSDYTDKGKEISYPFQESFALNLTIPMPGAVGIEYEEKDKLFKYIPVLKTDPIENLPTYSKEELALMKTIYAKDANITLSEKEESMQRMMEMMNDDEKKKNKLEYKGSWNELQTTNFIDEVSVYSPEKGEVKGAITTALALTRKIGNKEQRIMIIGDSDSFSNGELGSSRTGIQSGAYHFIQGLFYWLSNDEAPIDTRRPPLLDNGFGVTKKQMPFINAIYKFVIPSLLLLSIIIIWLRRKGR